MSQSKPYILLTLSTSKSCKVSHWFTMLQLMSLLGILSTVLNTINYYIVFILITLCNSNLHVTSTLKSNAITINNIIFFSKASGDHTKSK